MNTRKLTYEDAETIRLFYTKYGYSQRGLATMYEVGRTTIRRILDNETYVRKPHRPTTGPSPVVTDNVSLENEVDWYDTPVERTWDVLSWLAIAASVGLAGWVGWLVGHASNLW
jgi:hypothetical protein